tara:strand:+ start:692 stop:967 length:276 start_codon:yes stop_codon:yes gene_type:complete
MYNMCNNGVAFRISDGEQVPADGPSTLKEEYDVWISEGNLPTPKSDPVTPQEEINRLELLITPTRLSEAALGDTSWLQANSDLIAIERAKI